MNPATIAKIIESIRLASLFANAASDALVIANNGNDEEALRKLDEARQRFDAASDAWDNA